MITLLIIIGAGIAGGAVTLAALALLELNDDKADIEAARQALAEEGENISARQPFDGRQWLGAGVKATSVPITNLSAGVNPLTRASGLRRGVEGVTFRTRLAPSSHSSRRGGPQWQTEDMR